MESRLSLPTRGLVPAMSSFRLLTPSLSKSLQSVSNWSAVTWNTSAALVPVSYCCSKLPNSIPPFSSKKTMGKSSLGIVRQSSFDRPTFIANPIQWSAKFSPVQSQLQIFWLIGRDQNFKTDISVVFYHRYLNSTWMYWTLIRLSICSRVFSKVQHKPPSIQPALCLSICMPLFLAPQKGDTKPTPLFL